MRSLRIYYDIFFKISAPIVQWLGRFVVAEDTWVRFPLGAKRFVFSGKFVRNCTGSFVAASQRGDVVMSCFCRLKNNELYVRHPLKRPINS